MNLISRLPFVLIGALGILSLANQINSLPEFMHDWLVLWDRLVDNVWFWLPERFWDWTGDYLTMGLIIAGMELRAEIYAVYGVYGQTYPDEMQKYRKSMPDYLIDFLGCILLWPVLLAISLFFLALLFTPLGPQGHQRTLEIQIRRVYWESALLALIILGLSGLFK